MPDFQTEIRNDKLHDIKQERYLLRYDIWSGAISGFLGGANDICALLRVYRRFKSTFPSRNVRTKLPIYAAQNRRRAQTSKFIDSVVYITVSLDITSLKLLLTTKDWQSNTQFRSSPVSNPAAPRTVTAGSNLQPEVALTLLKNLRTAVYCTKFADRCLLHKICGQLSTAQNLRTAVYCTKFADRCLLHKICGPLSTAQNLRTAVYCTKFADRCPLHKICGQLSTAQNLWTAVHCTKFADRCPLHKTHLVNFLAFHSTGCHLL
jgi:hypothetical protein